MIDVSSAGSFGFCRCHLLPLLIDSPSVLVQAQQIFRRVTEPCRNLGSISADWLHDLTAVCFDRLNGGGDAVNHDVDQQAGFGHRLSAQDPCTAHFTYRVIKGDGSIAARPKLPIKTFLVKSGRGVDVDCRNLDVADLSVTEGRLLCV